MTSKEQEIKILNAISHIRENPEMYLGTTFNPNTLVREVIDNAMDEAMNEYTSFISIEIKKDGEIILYDNGRGLPLEKKNHEGEEEITAKLLFTKIFSGGKFDKSNYKYSVGLHGIGLTVIHALSDYFEIEVGKNNQTYNLKMSQGITKKEEMNKNNNNDSFTKIKFKPDKSIFENLKPKIHENGLRALSLLKNTRIDIKNEMEGDTKFRTLSKFDLDKVFEDEMIFENNFQIDMKSENYSVNVIFNWSKNTDQKERGMVNLLPCNKGLHLRLIGRQLCKALESLKDELDFEDGYIGLKMFSIIIVPDQKFTSQSKETLAKSDTLRDLKGDIRKEIHSKLKDRKEDLNKLVKFIMSYKKSMNRLSKMQMIKSKVKMDGSSNRSLGTGIYDCTSKDRNGTELFIVEGNSAGGGLVCERDTKSQTVLPLRGKLMNVASEPSLKSILNNKEILNMVNSIGVGIKPNIDMEKLRYEKIILATDADPDGKNISSLIIGAISYLIPNVILEGKVYLAETPLYKQGRKFLYDEKNLKKNKNFTRFKGLGEMNSSELKSTLLNKDTRRIHKLEIDESSIDELIYTVRETQAKKKLLREEGTLLV